MICQPSTKGENLQDTRRQKKTEIIYVHLNFAKTFQFSHFSCYCMKIIGIVTETLAKSVNLFFQDNVDQKLKKNRW